MSVNFAENSLFSSNLILRPDLNSSRPGDSCPLCSAFQLSKLTEKKGGAHVVEKFNCMASSLTWSCLEIGASLWRL